jgi:hypothetical protein
MERELEKLRVITAKYPKRDIFNLDETALFMEEEPQTIACHCFNTWTERSEGQSDNCCV